MEGNIPVSVRQGLTIFCYDDDHFIHHLSVYGDLVVLADTKRTKHCIQALDTDDGSDEDSCTDEVADCEADSECDECNQDLSDSCTEPDWESTEDESFCADVEVGLDLRPFMPYQRLYVLDHLWMHSGKHRLR